MELTEEDWEREHLKERIYIMEKEWLEQQYYERQKPAIIKIVVPSLKNIKKEPKLLKQ